MSVSLVTGAGGFVGTNLVRALLSRGDTVHVFLRPEGNRWRLRDIEDKLIIHDINLGHHKQAVIDAVASIKPDYVFHLAHYGGNRGQTDTPEIYKVIVQGTKDLYEACEKIGTVQAIINTGSSSEYGPQQEAMREDMVATPVTDYGKAKLEATLYGESLRTTKNLPISTLRLFSVYGPYEAKTRLIPAVTLALMNTTAPQLSNPKAVLDLVYVDDVVDALLKATTMPFGIYNIGTGIETTLFDVVSMIKLNLASTLELTWGGDAGRGSETSHWRADMSRTREVFGWQPSTTLKAGIEKDCIWFKQNKKLYE